MMALPPQASNQKLARLPLRVVLVNCQLVGGADEGQPGFSLVFVKAVLFHQWDQSVG